MSMRTIARSSSNRNSASALASSVLPTPVGPRKRNEPVGRFSSAMPERARRTASDTARTASACPTTRLPSSSSMRRSLAVSPFEHAARGDAGPRRDDVGDVVRADLLLEHHVGVGGLRGHGELLLQLGDAAVDQLGRLGEVAVALRALRLALELLQLLLELAGGLDGAALVLPARGERGQLLALLGELGAQGGQPVDGGGVGLLRQRHLLDLQPTDGALHRVDLHRPRVDLHAEPGGGLVDQVDGLVGQEPRGDVAVGERGGGDERGVGDPHAVVHLVALLEPAQDADGVLHRRLADEHLLEPPLQGGVLLDALAVLVERGGADQAQLAAGQHRLDHVARVHRALGVARADDRVQLVDERDDLARGVGDLLEDGLEPLLELAAVLRPGHHRAEVERDHALAAQRLRHVTLDDPLGEPLDDGGLADAGLADQHRVVLGAPGQHLHDAADLGVAADHRVELALARALGEVDAVLLQGLVGALGIGAGDPAGAAHLGEGLAQRIGGGAVAAQQLGDRATRLGQPDEQVLGGDVLVAHLRGELLGSADCGECLAGELRRAHRGARRRGQPVRQLRQLTAHRRGIGADRGQQRRGDAVALGQQRTEQVGRADIGVARQRRGLDGRGDRLLRLGSGVEGVHPSRPPAESLGCHQIQRQKS